MASRRGRVSSPSRHAGGFFWPLRSACHRVREVLIHFLALLARPSALLLVAGLWQPRRPLADARLRPDAPDRDDSVR
jgi:hypothetical protein